MPGPSNQWTDWAIDLPRPPQTRGMSSAAVTLVLITLASYANRYGICHPSAREIARRVEMKSDRVALALKALEKIGYIRWVAAEGNRVSAWMLLDPPEPHP